VPAGLPTIPNQHGPWNRGPGNWQWGSGDGRRRHQPWQRRRHPQWPFEHHQSPLQERPRQPEVDVLRPGACPAKGPWLTSRRDFPLGNETNEDTESGSQPGRSLAREQVPQGSPK